MSRTELIVGQIENVRRYTASMLDATSPGDWFWMPRGAVTHVAWQVGHIAVAEYHLTMKRIRGPRGEDEALLGDATAALFGKGSTPSADAGTYPDAGEIRALFDRVHRQAIDELGRLSDGVLDEPVENPHPMFSTKLGALLFCAPHEMLHAGQIGLLRRLMGNEPLR